MARFASPESDPAPAPRQAATTRQAPAFDRGDDSAPSARRGGAPRKPNAYSGKCHRCGGWVEPKEGYLVGSRAEGWGVEHASCPSVQEPAATSAASAEFTVPDGTYTIVWGNHYKTIRVRKQDEFDDFMPGTVILSFLSGADNERDYTSFAHVAQDGSLRIWRKHQASEVLREAVKVLLGDPQACAVAYARETDRCWRCHRMLSTPESIERGMGAECAAKVGW